MENTHSHSFKTNKISIDETEKELETTHSDSSTEDDNISMKVIEAVASYIATALIVIIINFNPERKIFRLRKIARIIPIPKIRTPEQLCDYTPISALPILSKIYEKLVLKQVVDFIKNRKLYKPTQSGFTKKPSTSTLLVKIRENTITALRKGQLIIATFAYFPKQSTPFIIVY